MAAAVTTTNVLLGDRMVAPCGERQCPPALYIDSDAVPESHSRCPSVRTQPLVEYALMPPRTLAQPWQVSGGRDSGADDNKDYAEQPRGSL